MIRSARKMLMEPKLAWEEIQALALEAVEKFPAGTPLYIKPMFFCADGFLLPDASKTQFVLHVFKAPMPGTDGFSAHFSPYLRAWPSMAPTDAKASCLYPNGQRAIKEASAAGFDNAIMLDGDGNVAEFASSNIWIAKDGRISTPVDNGTFLNGITRQRVPGPAARRRRGCRRAEHQPCGRGSGGRGVLDRQLRQGDPREPRGGSQAPVWPGGAAGAQAVHGLRAGCVEGVEAVVLF